MRKGIRLLWAILGLAVISGCGAPEQAENNSLVQQELQATAPKDEPTNFPTTILTPTVTITPTPSSLPMNTPTLVLTSTPTPSSLPMNTPTLVLTSTPTPLPTNTPTPLPTSTPTPLPTNTPTPVPTSTPTPVPTSTPTPVPTSTPTPVPTNTPTPVPTSTPTPVPTNTPTPVPTSTPTPKPEFYTSETWKNAEVGDIVRFGVYEQDNEFANGSEEIEWIILDEDENYFQLHSVYALEAMPYMEEGNRASWKNSMVREWLNEDFYNQAFDEVEKERIALTQTDGWIYDKSYREKGNGAIAETYLYEETKDYVYLLSMREYGEKFAMKYVENISEYVESAGYDLDGDLPVRWTSSIFMSGSIGVCRYNKEYERALVYAEVDSSFEYLIYPAIWVAKEGKAGQKDFYTAENIFKVTETTNGVIIEGMTDRTKDVISIPPSIGGKKVIGIGAKAFSDYTKLKRVKIPENVISIASDAFSVCKNLNEVHLPSTLKEVQNGFFDNIADIRCITYASGLDNDIRKILRKRENPEIWEVIESDTGRYGDWNLTYLEFIEMYESIGTENDLFLKMLKEKGTAHTEDDIYYEYDGISNLEFTFQDVLTEKIYALHYAPFDYNSEDFASGNYAKSTLEAYQDHGGVCGILTETYLHFLHEILGENLWRYCIYSNAEVDHAALLVKTEDGRVFQIDNADVDFWWLGIQMQPDYEKISGESDDERVTEKFQNWWSNYQSFTQKYWYNYRIACTDEKGEWRERPVWFNWETNEFETYCVSGFPKHYTITYYGLPEKVIGMAGCIKMDGYVDLSELWFGEHEKFYQKFW